MRRDHHRLPLADPRCPWCGTPEPEEQHDKTDKHCTPCDRAYSRLRQVRRR